MSQFNSLSESFKESLQEWGDSLIEKSKSEENKVTSSNEESMAKLASAFISGPFMSWYETLEDSSKEEVNRVFSEIGKLSSKEVLGLMNKEGSTTPLGFVDNFFLPTEKVDETEIVVDEGSEDNLS